MIVSDSTGQTNFILFGKTTETLIEFPIEFLTKSTRLLNNVLPLMVGKIVGTTKVFQVVIDLNQYDPNNICFKFVKVFKDSIFDTMAPEKSFFIEGNKDQIEDLPKDTSHILDVEEPTPSELNLPSCKNY